LFAIYSISQAELTKHCFQKISVGFLASNKFEEMLGDSHAIMTAEGDNSVLMMKVAKERLAWAEKTKKASDVPVVFNGFVDVLNPEYLLWLFRRREALVIVQLQGTMDRDMRLGASLFEVWQKRQSDAVQLLAKAYIERVCLEQMLEEAKANRSLAPMLQKLAVLFALDSVSTDMAWFVFFSLGLWSAARVALRNL